MTDVAIPATPAEASNLSPAEASATLDKMAADFRPATPLAPATPADARARLDALTSTATRFAAGNQLTQQRKGAEEACYIAVLRLGQCPLCQKRLPRLSIGPRAVSNHGSGCALTIVPPRAGHALSGQ
jgi:hypothetical protein